MAITAQTRTDIVQLVVSMLGEAPSTAMLTDLVTKANAGSTIQELADSLATNAAFTSAFPVWMTSKEFTTKIVNNMFAGGTVTQADTDAAIDYIAGAITAGTFTKTSAVVALTSYMASADGAANASYGSASQAYQNKVEVAEYFTITKGMGDATAAERKAAIANVTSEASSVTAEKASADTVATAATVVPAQNATLSTSADTITGGSGDDTVIGVIGTNALTASGTTLQAGDNINLGAGTDTLAISIAGTHTGGTNTTTVSLTDIEKIQVSNYETSANLDTIDLALASGLGTVSLYGSIANGDVAFTGAKNILASEMWNGAGDLSVGYAAAAVAGLTDVASLTVSGATAGTFTSAGVETLNIVSAGTNALTSVASGYKAVNISGGKLTLGNLGTTATVAVDATEQTGKLTATLAGTGTLAVKVGSGGSAIDATADTITKADTITGGAGADALTINTATMTNATLVGVTGVETLNYDVASTITLTKATDFTTFDFDDAGNQSLILSTGYTGAVTVDITGDATNADVITNTANVAVTVKGNAADFDAATDINGSATGIETLLIKADGNTAVITGAGAIDAVDQITIVDGTVAGTDVTLDVNAYGTALTIDATALDAGTTAASADNEFLTISNVSNKALTVKGGGGPDVIQDSASADTIEGNGGADVITADQGGVDTIKGGAGNDTINMGATLTAADVIDGGEGTDTLNVTAITAAALAGVTNVETLGYTAAGALSLAADLSFDAISLEGTNNTALTFATGYKKAMSVNVEDGDSVINTAKIALTVNADDDELAAGDNTILTGSATTVDTLNILNKTAAATVDMQTATTNFDVVNILDYALTAGNDITIDVTSHGSALGTLTIDASALDAGTTAASADNEVFTMTGAATASLRVTGGGAGDTIVLGTGKDVIDAGAGADTITAGANHTYEDTVDGGAGTDTIAATAAVDIDFQNTSNIEKLTATTSAVLANFAQLAGISTVTLVGTATLNASGMTSGVTVIAPAATTNASGSLGDDVFVFQATETLTAADTINGVAGNDIIRLDNDDNADKAGDAVAATLDASVTNIDTVLVNDIGSTDTAGNVTVTLDTTFAQKALEIDGSALDLGEVLTIAAGNNSALETVTVKGGAGADVIVTGAAKDVITGGGAADTITAGGGADTITGGAGADNFVYTVTNANASTHSTSAAKDTITDFTAKSDNLNLTVALANGGQTVDYNDKGNTTSVADGLSLLSSVKGQYFFDTTNSQVVFDLDGNGLIQATDLMISMTGATGILESDVNITITGGTGADTIVTGDGNDVFVASNGIDAITTGGGSDTVSYAGIVAEANANNVSDFAAASDIIQFSDASLALVAGAYTAGTAVTFANVAGITDTANQVIFDTAANLGAKGATIGNQSGKTNIKHQLAIESDTGKIFFDANGDWTAGSLQIGQLTVTGTLTAANVEIVA